MNPTDVFPRRNLPGEAEEWGRKVEDRVRGVEFAASSGKQDTQSLNRTTASSLQELTRQLQSLEDLYNFIPKPQQSSEEEVGFALAAGTNTVVTASLTVPKGASLVNLVAIGSGHLITTTTGGLVTTQSRLELVGHSASPWIMNGWYTGSGDFRTVMAPSYSWTATVTPETLITVNLQVYPDNAGMYGFHASNYAVLSLLGTFTG
jgi:hypothetical protein